MKCLASLLLLPYSLIASINLPASHSIVNGADVFFDLSFLYFEAAENTIIGLTGIATATQTTPLEKGSALEEKASWNPGFKVKLGINLPRDHWILSGQYTWYRSSENHQVINQPPSIYPTLPSNMSPIFANRVESDWDLKFSSIDIELARMYYTSPYVILNPSMGLKGAWITDHHEIQYSLSSMNQANLDYTHKFNGVGIVTALSLEHYISLFISLYTRIAFSTLWGKVRTTETENLEDSNHQNTRVLINTCSRTHQMVPVIEIMLGLSKEGWSSCDRYHYTFTLGWETQVWFLMNTLNPMLHTGIPYGSLYLNGLTLRAQLEF